MAKLFLTSFPGLNDEGKFDENILASQLVFFKKTIVVRLLFLWKIKNLKSYVIKNCLLKKFITII